METYYTLSQRASKQADDMQAFFRATCPTYSVLTDLALFFFANASPQWTIFATSF